MPLRRLPAWAIFAIAFAVAAATFNLPARADDGAQTAHESALLDRIFANWKARSDRLKSVHYTWDCHTIDRKGMLDHWIGPTRLDHDQETKQFGVQFWMEGDEKFSVVLTPVFRVPPEKFVDPKRTVIRLASVGAATMYVTLCPLYKTDEQAARPFVPYGNVFATDTMIWQFPDPIFPMLFAFRPQHPSLRLRKDQCHVVTENAVVDGGHYVKLQRVIERHRDSDSANTDREEVECWVDPAREDVVVHWVNRDRYTTLEGSIKYREDKKYGWLPSEWSFDRRGVQLQEFKSISYAINEKIDPVTFLMAFPAGTVVLDRLNEPNAEVHYVVQPDGSKKTISFKEWRRLRNFSEPPKRPVPAKPLAK